MITSVCANPCIDREVRVDGFELGRINRIDSERSDASGKGINVAIAARRLGAEVSCLGFNYEDNGYLETERLQTEGIYEDLIYVPGAIRTNLKIIDTASGRMTELNERGCPVPMSKQEELEELVRLYGGKSSFMTFSGSVPQGVEKDFYYRLVKAAKAQKCKCVLDCDGALLLEGIKAQPDILKPNDYELGQFFGETFTTVDDLLGGAHRLIDLGVGIVFITLGKEGALITNGSESYFLPPIDVQVINTVGAGDSAVAGLITALEKGADLKTAAMSGVAAATATVMTKGSLLLRYEDYVALMERATARRIG